MILPLLLLFLLLQKLSLPGELGDLTLKSSG